MTVISVGGLIVIEGESVQRALALISSGIRNTHARNGIAPHPEAVEMQQALQRADAYVSADGRTDVHRTEVGAESEPEPDDVIDPSEAAKILHVSRRSVHRYIADDQLQGRKRGGRWKLDKTQVDDFAHEREERNHGRH